MSNKEYHFNDISSNNEFTGESKPATSYTSEINGNIYKFLDFEDKREFENASKGLIANPDSLEITDDNGKIVWSQKAYEFLSEEAPDTANPSLWRNAGLNHIYGLFEVTDGIYQVRGYDMANVTFIKGNSGWIVIDPLMSVECSKAAVSLVNDKLGEFPVKAVIYTHPHIDHFGGVKGVVSEEDVISGKVDIYAPEGFEKHAVSENIYAGNAMQRRASYQYGTILKGSKRGSLCIGIGMGQSRGLTSYISPTVDIKYTGEKHIIDGLEVEFQLTLGTEAPVEMNMWIESKNALCMAENCTGTLHNLYTLRGAQVRDGNAWAEYIMEALNMYGDRVDVVYQSHNWPHWGNEDIKEYLTNTAAAYKCINDQALLYINKGYTETEVSHMVSLPKELEKVWYTRQYYGTVTHNAKAVYEKYMGWYDANPIHLNELDPSSYGKKLMSYLGDTKTVLNKAKEDYDRGEYQWVAQITNTIIFADPGNEDARYLCADALEQLGYQAESGTWRNAYLSAAFELRNGTNNDTSACATGSEDAVAHMTPEMIFDYLGILVDTSLIQDLSCIINVIIPEGTYVINVKNGVILYRKAEPAKGADVTWTTDRRGLLSIIKKNKEYVSSLIKQDGDVTLTDSLMNAVSELEDYKFFNIVEP